MRLILLSCSLVLVACVGGTAAAPASPSPATPSPVTAAPGTSAPPAAAEAPPWGAPVSAPDVEARVAAILVRLRDGKLEGGDTDVAVLFGAGLWSTWKVDGVAGIETIGIPMMTRVPFGDRVVLAHGRAIRFADLAPFLASDVVRRTSAVFAAGEVRAATDLERRVYYGSIGWEIDGKPVSVSQTDGGTLVVILDDDGHLFQIDLLDPWAALLQGHDSAIAQYQPPSPIP